jgi:hypothetical protein
MRDIVYCFLWHQWACELKVHIDTFIETYNETARPFEWTASEVHQKRLKPRFAGGRAPKGGAAGKTTSSPGRRVWRPTAPSCTKSPAVPARRLLADAGACAHRCPGARSGALRSSTRCAPTAESRRPRRRDEDDHPGSAADVVPRPRYASRALAYSPPRHLSVRAQRPERRAHPVNPRTFSIPHSGPTSENSGASASKRNKKTSRPRRFARRNGQSAA